MPANDSPIHYVSTHEQAWQLIKSHDRYWVSNCGCRENHGHCNRSRMDVCLLFREDYPPSGTGVHEISFRGAVEILGEAKETQLVARPFRNENNMAEVDGICFCCDDCCGYFTDPTEICDRGTLIESTEMELCIDCGVCVDVCYFGARRLVNGRLVVEGERCYGCGQCIEVCSLDIIKMVDRN